MKKFTVNTICDIDGFKQVFTVDGISKVWYFQWYDFTRKINQVANVEILEVQAEGYNHALDVIRNSKYTKKSISDNKNLLLKVNALESRILQKYGKTLKGKASRSKINSFLR